MKLSSWLLKTVIAAFAVIALAVVLFTVLPNNADIPKLYIDGDISKMLTKSDVRDIAIRYVDGTEEITGYAKIKIQGTSSIGYRKKNYTVEFFEDSDHDNKLKINVGWGDQNKYCFKANWIDRTHARNVVAARLASQMQAKYDLLTNAPKNGLVDGFPVEIYSNGIFLGLYTMNIPKDAWQFDMDKDNQDHIVIGGEGWSDANLFHAMPSFETWAVEVGEESPETLAKMERLFDFVINSTDEEFRDQFEEYFDLDSALNYYVFSDITYLADNLGKNMLLATYDGMVWYLSLYDLDTSWGTRWDGFDVGNYDTGLLKLKRNNLFARMEKVFPELLAERYFELREDILSNEHMMEELEAFRDEIPASTMMKEKLRWWLPYVLVKAKRFPGYDYSQIEEYLNAVSTNLDNKYAAMLG